MRHENFVVFHNDSDSSYMNSADNFRGAEIGAAQKIDIYFESATSAIDTGSYDRVRLNVDAAGNEEKALEAIAGALQGNKSGLTVMADDKLGTYFSDFFTGVDSFTTASMSMKRRTEAITTTKSLETTDSGKVFTVAQSSNYSITLPTVAQAGAGWHATFIMQNEGNFTVKIIPDSSEDTLRGSISSAAGGGVSAETGVDELIFVANTAKNGERIDILCTGSFFEVSGFIHDDDHVTLA